MESLGLRPVGQIRCGCATAVCHCKQWR